MSEFERAYVRISKAIRNALCDALEEDENGVSSEQKVAALFAALDLVVLQSVVLRVPSDPVIEQLRREFERLRESYEQAADVVFGRKNDGLN